MLVDNLIDLVLNRVKAGNLGAFLTPQESLSAEPMLGFAFRVFIPGTDLLYTYAKSVTAPLPAHKQFVYQTEGNQVHVVSTPEIPDFSIEFHEDEFSRVLKEMEKWRISMYDPTTGIYGLPSHYKRNVYILTVDRDQDIATQIVARGAIIKSMSGYDFSTSKIADPVALKVSFSADAVYFAFTDKKNRQGFPLPFVPGSWLFGNLTRSFDGQWPWRGK